MFLRLRQLLWLLIAVSAGYVIGSGPSGEWVPGVWHFLCISWHKERVSRGSAGAVPLLIAGFFIGQGLYLLIRRIVLNFGVQRARRFEAIAAWDRSLQISTRFGLHRYLERCALWAAEDPTNRTPSLALFKIRGLGALNYERGTLVTTRLLRKVATELRLAALPESMSQVAHWMAQYRPRPIPVSAGKPPFPRFPARWSGATFALAFRQLDAVQSASIARDVATWINGEIASLSLTNRVTLVAGIAIGCSNVKPSSLVAAAVKSIDRTTPSALITVVHDPEDLRTTSIAQMSDTDVADFTMDSEDSEGDMLSDSALSLRQRFVSAARNWGAAIGCLTAAVLLLGVTGSKSPVRPVYYSWPDQLREIQIVDASGPRTVRLVRTNLGSQQAGNYALLNVSIVQGDPSDGRLEQCQIDLTIKNNSKNTLYVSVYDFAAIDASQQELAIEPERMVRSDKGITGKWMQPGEEWSGLLLVRRRNNAIKGLSFRPDRFTHLIFAEPA